MEQVRLGRSGLWVSEIALGMMSFGSKQERPWHLDESEAHPIVCRAVEAGVTFFDTADMYSDGLTEEMTGRLIRQAFSRREDYVLATKVYFPTGSGPNDRGLSRRHVLAAIDASLRRLGTDYVDLYQIHRWDETTPIEETMAVLHDVVKAGKARYLGASSMWAWQLAEAQHVAAANGWTPFVSMQNHYNLLYREEEREMIPYCATQGVGVIPYSPLARGALARGRSGSARDRSNRSGSNRSGSNRSGTDPLADAFYEEHDEAVISVAAEVARARGVSPAQVALAWLLSKSAVSAPILGATRTGHIDDAVAATTLRLDDAEVATLEAPYRPHRVLGHE